MNYKRMLGRINSLEERMRAVNDDELRSLADKIKSHINGRRCPQWIVAEVFAIVREVDRRILKMFPTDEQVLGALVIYDGKISEIKTGEGKSLVATMPLYLKAISVGHAFLVTTNDYLAKRDCEHIGKVFEWLGLKVADGTNNPDHTGEFDVIRKKNIYSADIIYISNGTLGFDYLIDGLAEKVEDRFMSSLDFALLDEVDQILLDSAQQPLIISGAPKVQSNYFQVANMFVSILRENIEYKFNTQRNQVWLTEEGIERTRKYFNLPNILDSSFFTLYQHIILAMKAHHTLEKNKDYIVESGKVKLLDSKDGRVLEGTNLPSGLHQAIEAKESVEISQESQTISSITFQNLFRNFRELSGMSGTVKVAEDELINTYNLSVKKIKTTKKIIRKDHQAQRYVTTEAKVNAVLEKIKELYKLQRPQLIIAGSVETSELISLHLFNLGIPHNVLNAKSSIKEAQIVKEAGSVGAVTVSTSMAGRGTDIKLTSESIQKGGLAVIITERLLNKRIELQAQGRAGRQGEPGDTYLFESLEDEVIKRHVKERVQKFYDKHLYSENKIKSKKIQRCFKKAQKISEEQAYSQRSSAFQYDEILKLQKQMVNKSRMRILELESITEAIEIVKENIQPAMMTYFKNSNPKKVQNFHRFILDNVDYNFKGAKISFRQNDENQKIEFVKEYLEIQLNKKCMQINDDKVFLQYLKICMLKAVDVLWSKQVDALDHLRLLVQQRTVGQKRSIWEFEKEAKMTYDVHRKELSCLLLKNVALSLVQINDEMLVVTFP